MSDVDKAMKPEDAEGKDKESPRSPPADSGLEMEVDKEQNSDSLVPPEPEDKDTVDDTMDQPIVAVAKGENKIQVDEDNTEIETKPITTIRTNSNRLTSEEFLKLCKPCSLPLTPCVVPLKSKVPSPASSTSTSKSLESEHDELSPAPIQGVETQIQTLDPSKDMVHQDKPEDKTLNPEDLVPQSETLNPDVPPGKSEDKILNPVDIKTQDTSSEVPNSNVVENGLPGSVVINSAENPDTPTSLASSCPNMMAALMNPTPSTMGRPVQYSSTTTVIPGTKDSDGFLTPPPASTLLIRRTRTNSTGSSTYVVASPPTRKPPETIPVPPPTAMESLLLQRRQSRKSDSSRSGRSIKRPKFDDERVEFSTSAGPSSSGPGVSYVTHSSLHSRGYLPPISPLAIDPTHSLSVTISSDRSIATHISPGSPQSELMFNSINALPSISSSSSLPATPSTSASSISSMSNPQPSTSASAIMADLRNSKPKVSRGKPAYITENYNGGKGSKKRRSFERSASLDSARKRSARRRQRLSTEHKYSRSNRGSRSYSESSLGCELDQGGSWRPADDLRLIVNVLQTNDLELVYRGVKFSCKYTLENITARWQLLLYDKPTSKVSQLAIKNLHPKTVATIHSEALFSKEEDNLLKSIRSTLDPKNVPHIIEKLLSENALVFLKWRKPKILFDHWLLLREYYMLCDQDVSEYFAQESFSDFENNLSDQECRDNIELDAHVRREAIIENRHARRKIRMLEEEVSKWEILANMVSEIEPRPFEESSYAMLRGKQVRYLMRSKEITLGRRTSESMNVDAELSMEGSTYKVSRKQATIQLRPLGDFAILNQGKHAIFVDGNVVVPGQLWRLVDQSVIEISRLRFVFLINHKMVANYKRRQIKSEVRKEMMDLSKLARAIKATSSGLHGSSSKSSSSSIAGTSASANISH